MNLSDFMHKELMLIDLLSDTKEDIIKELICPIIKTGFTDSEEPLYKAILDREALGSTAIGKGVAIPHAETTSVKEKIIVFGRSKKGIDFNAIDGKPVHLFFMIISPHREISPHLKILARIFRFLKDKTFRDALMNAKSSEDIMELIAMEEKPSSERSNVNEEINQERRKYPRYPIAISVELRLQDDSVKHLIGYYGYTKNISLGGIYVKIPRHKNVEYPRMEEKTKLQVKIPVLDIQKYLELNGEIAWCLQKEEDCNIGVQFISNNEEIKACLSRFVESVK